MRRARPRPGSSWRCTRRRVSGACLPGTRVVLGSQQQGRQPPSWGHAAAPTPRAWCLALAHGGRVRWALVLPATPVPRGEGGPVPSLGEQDAPPRPPTPTPGALQRPPTWTAGIVEGFTEERAGLQEALGRKEASEQGLVAELEGLRQQLQCAARRQAELQEENSVLWSQKEALAVEAGERETGKEAELQPGARAEPGWLGHEALRAERTRLRGRRAARGLRAAAVADCAVGKAADSEAGSPGQGVAHLCAVISLGILEAVVQQGVSVWDERIAVWSAQIRVPLGNRNSWGF